MQTNPCDISRCSDRVDVLLRSWRGARIESIFCSKGRGDRVELDYHFWAVSGSLFGPCLVLGRVSLSIGHGFCWRVGVKYFGRGLLETQRGF